MEKQNKKKEIEKINDEEEEKLKLLNKVEYTDEKIISISLEKNKKEWKKIFREISCKILYESAILLLPRSKGILLDVIISSKNIDESLNSFKKLLLILILKSILDIISKSIESSNNERNKNNKELLDKIIEKDIQFFDVYKTGELIGKINDLENRELNLLDDYIIIYLNIFKIFYMAYYLITTSFYLSIVFSILFSLDILSEYICSYFIQSEKSAIIISENNNKFRNKVYQLITNIRMIKSFAREKKEVNSLENYIYTQNFKESLKYYSFLEIKNFIKNINNPILLLFVGKFILEGKCTLGTFIIFRQYKEDFINSYNSIKFGKKSKKIKIQTWKKFLELTEFPVKIKTVENYIPKKIKGKINFDKVTFAYPLKPKSNVLKDLTFCIEPGKTLAICGFSGSGKTTISNLLERFYDVNEGNIFIDDIDIKDYNIEYLRKNIGYVAQEPVLNSGTILSNIIYGVDSYEEAELNEILKLTYIDTFINDKLLFPDGLNTLVGERGVRISGGQKQRIAIARALMKNSKILIFDEATSALDSESESAIQKAIDNIVKKKEITIIIIAHRLSTIIKADKIIVLNEGTVVETGNHNELINKRGEYKKLFEKQLLKL